MKLLAIALCLALVVSALADTPWKNCGTSTDHLHINSLTISPEEPVPGQDFTVTIDATLDEVITAGTFHIDVEYLGIKIFSHTYDICTFTPELTCPIAKGPVKMSKTEKFPSVVPKGTYKGKIVAVDQTQSEIACLTFDVKVSVSLEDSILDDAMIADINAAGHWTAARTPAFEGKTIRDVVSMLGTRLDGERYPLVRYHAANIPDTFDARKQWPGCVHSILDQGQCGSCWAFGATEALSDRFCVASKGSTNVVLSPQYLVSCDNTDYGCQGGYLTNAWEFMMNHGVCTESCFPYESGTGSVPACPTKCKDGSAMKLYKVKAGTIVQPSGVSSIQTEIMNNGPVETGFEVYQDFMSYSGGVYKHVTGKFLGGHAVKIIGWGVDSGTPYWLVANSWGAGWGLEGYFKILRGSDECEFEDGVIAGTPALQGESAVEMWGVGVVV